MKRPAKTSANPFPPVLTTDQARNDINNGCQQLVINALVNDLAQARVKIAELEAQLAAQAKQSSDAPA